MSNKLTVIEQKEVTFYDDELTAVRADDGQIYVSLRHMCESLGLNTQGQTRRIQRNEILSEGLQRVAIMSTHRGKQQAYVLRADLVPLWLSGVEISRVKDEVRPKLKQFQREAAKVLWEAFQSGRLTTEPSLTDMLATDSPAAQAYRIASAVLEIARNQLLIESRVTGIEERLESIESQLSDPGVAVSQDQAMQISQAVKTVAIVVSKESKRNEFGAVYGELYRYFGITSYKQLPRAKFDECIEWLNNWYVDVTGEPF